MSFDPELVRKMAENLSVLQASDTQKDIIDKVSSVLNMYLGIEKDALVALGIELIIKWQQENNKPLVVLENSTENERVPVVKKIFDEMQPRLEKMLVDPADASRLDFVMETAFVFYQEKFSRR